MSATADDVAGRLEARAASLENIVPVMRFMDANKRADKTEIDSQLDRASASLIRSQVARIEKLEGALKWFDEMRMPLINALYAAASKSEEDGGDPKYWDSLLADLRNAQHRTRAALERT